MAASPLTISARPFSPLLGPHEPNKQAVYGRMTVVSQSLLAAQDSQVALQEIFLRGIVRVAFDCEFAAGNAANNGTLLAVGWRAVMVCPHSPDKDVVVSRGLFVYRSLPGDHSEGAIPPSDRSEAGWALVAKARNWTQDAWSFWKKNLSALNSLYEQGMATQTFTSQQSLAAAYNSELEMWERATSPPVDCSQGSQWEELNRKLRQRHGWVLGTLQLNPSELQFEFDTSSSDLNWLNKLLERNGYPAMSYDRAGQYASNGRIVNVTTLLSGATGASSTEIGRIMRSIRSRYTPCSSEIGLAPLKNSRGMVMHNPLLDTERIQAYGSFARRLAAASAAMSSYMWKFQQGLPVAYPEQAAAVLDELMPIVESGIDRDREQVGFQ
jgi:hypothetical protein